MAMCESNDSIYSMLHVHMCAQKSDAFKSTEYKCIIYSDWKISLEQTREECDKARVTHKFIYVCHVYWNGV